MGLAKEENDETKQMGVLVLVLYVVHAMGLALRAFCVQVCVRTAIDVCVDVSCLSSEASEYRH